MDSNKNYGVRLGNTIVKSGLTYAMANYWAIRLDGMHELCWAP